MDIFESSLIKFLVFGILTMCYLSNLPGFDLSNRSRWIFFPRESVHAELIVKESLTVGLDPSLVMAVVAQESQFQEHAQSYSGARGLMQIMPDTAFGGPGRPGECMDLPCALSDPKQNVRCGIRVLRNRLREFRGDEAMALQAYHDGASGARWIRWWGGFRHASKESREYVPRVLLRRPAYALLYQRQQ